MSEKTRIKKQAEELSDDEIEELVHRNHSAAVLSEDKFKALRGQGDQLEDTPGFQRFDSFGDFKRYLKADLNALGYPRLERRRILRETLRHELSHALAARAIDPSCDIRFGVVHLRNEDGDIGTMPLINIGGHFDELEELIISSAPKHMSDSDHEDVSRIGQVM